MRKLHRTLAIVMIVAGLWIGVTGVIIQSLDLKALLSGAPPTDATIISIREGRDGPPNFAVLTVADYAAPALPSGFDFDRALRMVLFGGRRAAAGVPFAFVELRMMGGKPVGQIASGGKLLKIDASDGAILAGPQTAAAVKLPPGGGGTAFRAWMKGVHRLNGFGDWLAPIFTAIGLIVCLATFTGLVLYFRLLQARARMKRRAPFWSAGGAWRTFHRVLSVLAGGFLAIVAVTGTLCSIASIGVVIYRAQNHGMRPGVTADVSSPLSDAVLPGMLHATLSAYRATDATEPIKVVRLRMFAGDAQGVIVAGNARDSRQYAFETATGAPAPLQGPNYPNTGQTWGWGGVQLIKSIHRGDYFGLAGRFLSLFTGLSLIFLSTSGAAMYFDMWKRRAKAGRRAVLW